MTYSRTKSNYLLGVTDKLYTYYVIPRSSPDPRFSNL